VNRRSFDRQIRAPTPFVPGAVVNPPVVLAGPMEREREDAGREPRPAGENGGLVVLQARRFEPLAQNRLGQQATRLGIEQIRPVQVAAARNVPGARPRVTVEFRAGEAAGRARIENLRMAGARGLQDPRPAREKSALLAWNQIP